MFFTSLLKVCCCFTSRQRRDASSKGPGQAAELEKAAPLGLGLWRSSLGQTSMRKAGLALQSPVSCVSGCFSSHSGFKSHPVPAPMLLPAPAWLQSGVVLGWSRGREAGRTGRAVFRRLLPTPQDPHPQALGESGLQQHPCAQLCPHNGAGLPSRAWWYRAALGDKPGMLFLQALFVPLA